MDNDQKSIIVVIYYRHEILELNHFNVRTAEFSDNSGHTA
jgi:hypothetical protein